MNDLARSTALSLALGERIARLREKRGLSQVKLAEKISMHDAYVSRIERGTGNPTLFVLGKFARALNVSLSELFDELPTHLRPAPRLEKRGRPRRSAR